MHTLTLEALGARKRLHLQWRSCPFQSSSCHEWWMDFLCHLRSANVVHMEEHTCVFPCPLMHLPLKHTQSVTSAFQTEKVNCFLSEDVWRARGAKNLTFPSVPMALIWSHGDLAFSSASSWENVQNFEKAPSSQIFFSSEYTNTLQFNGIKTLFLFTRIKLPLISQDPNYPTWIKMHVCTLILLLINMHWVLKGGGEDTKC